MNAINRRNQRGLSLIEVMIALLIGAILSLSLVQIYGASREAYRLTEGLSRVQESGRFAMDFLQRDIRMAGHFGCVNDQARLQTADLMRSNFPLDGARDYTISILGYDGAPPAAVYGTLNPAPLAGSDSLVLRYLAANGVPVTAINAASRTVSVDPAKWPVVTAGGVAAPRMFGVADCAYADIFTATAAGAGTVTAPSPVDFERYGVSPEGGPATLYRAEAIIYYIGNSGDGSGRPSLWRARIGISGNPVSEELVQGVENMQFRYGVDGTTDPARPTGYIATQRTATQLGTTAANWRLVGQVQVALLIASPDLSSSVQSTNQKNLLGTLITPANDGRYRSVYQSTIALRNRLYGN